jgi:hypothetical protein
VVVAYTELLRCRIQYENCKREDLSNWCLDLHV